MAPTPTTTTTTTKAAGGYVLPQLDLGVIDLSSVGSRRFIDSIDSTFLETACLAVLRLLYPAYLPHSVRPSISKVIITLRSFPGVAYTCSSSESQDQKEIHFSTDYIASVVGDEARIAHEIRGVLVHELVHVFQHNGHDSLPGGIVEGIADWIRLKASLAPPHWGPRSGERWDQGYDATAQFLEYLSTTIAHNLVPILNSKMKDEKWDDGSVFREMIGGRDVDALWTEYKNDKESSSDATHSSDGLSFAIPTHPASHPDRTRQHRRSSAVCDFFRRLSCRAP